MITTEGIDRRVHNYIKQRNLEAEKGTRIIKEEGRMGTLKYWIESLQEEFGNDLIPYEWVADYVMVSRVALMKRVKKGQLTVFSYRILESKDSLFGRTKLIPSRIEYKFVPRQECDAWLLNSLHKYGHVEKSDLNELRPNHVSGWWDEIDET